MNKSYYALEPSEETIDIDIFGDGTKKLTLHKMKFVEKECDIIPFKVEDIKPSFKYEPCFIKQPIQERGDE